jgi:hypothetical protein
MYSDEEILALELQYDLLEAPTRAGVIAFARALLAGEKAMPWGDAIGLKRLMAMTDASQSGLGHGIAVNGYWRELCTWKGPRGNVVLEGTYGATAGKFSIDVTELAKGWQAAPWEHFGLLLVSGNLDLNIHSRQALDPLVRPKLLINGSVEVPCVADASLSSSTTKEQGAATYLKLANTSQVALRFADIDPALTIERAQLALTIQRGYDVVGTWRLLEIVPPVAFEVPRIGDIFGNEGNYFESASLGCDPVSPYESYLHTSIFKATTYGKASMEQEGGEKFARLYWNNTKQTNNFAIPVYRGHVLGNSDPTEGRHVHLSYKIRLAENFPTAVVTTGKFPGFSSAGKQMGTYLNPWPGEPNRGNKRGELYAGNGGGAVHGYDGWSARGAYTPRIRGVGHPAAGCVPIGTYAYFLRKGSALAHELYKRYERYYGVSGGYTLSQPIAPLLQPGESIYAGSPTVYGHALHWDYGAPSGLLWPGRWHRVDQIIRVNDPTEANGELDTYVDGRQVGRIRDMQWRSHERKLPLDSTLAVANCWFNFYQGGVYEYRNMTQETRWDLRQVAVKVLEWDE